MPKVRTKKPARSRTPEQLADAARLMALYAQAKKDKGMTQEKLAALMGFETQGAVSQYLNGDTVLNYRSLVGFARVFGVPLEEISPTLAAEMRELLSMVAVESDPQVQRFASWFATLNPQARKVFEQFVDAVPKFLQTDRRTATLFDNLETALDDSLKLSPEAIEQRRQGERRKPQ